MRSNSRAVLSISFLVAGIFCFQTLIAAGPSKAPERPEEKRREEQRSNETPEAKKARLEEEAKKRTEQERIRSATPGSGGSIGEGGESTRRKSTEPEKSVSVEGKGSHEGGARNRFGGRSSNLKVEIKELKQLTDATKKALEQNEALMDAVVKEQEKQWKAYEKDESARQGFIVREQAFLDALGKSKEMGEAEAKAFEKSIIERLKGDKGKAVTKEDLESFKSLACTSDCGHRGTAKSCSRVVKFLAASQVAALTPVALAAAWAVYEKLSEKDAKDKGNGVRDLTVDFDGGSIKVEDIDKKVIEEKVAPEASEK
jgi:hypothetical protein